MASWRIIIPVLNQHVTTFKGPVWYLGNGVYWRKIDDKDFGALWRHFGDKHDEYKTLVSPSTKCVYVDESVLDGELTLPEVVATAKKQATVVQSVLNLLSSGNPVVLSFAMVVRESRKPIVQDLVDLDPVSHMHTFRAQRYGIKDSVTQESIREMYTIVSEVIDRYPQTLVTLGRYNSSLTRAAESDRVIDITISLESLLRERHELRFKFATYLSFVAESTPGDRMKAFGMLMALYDTRSGLVHGTPEDRDVEKARKKVCDNWEYVARIAKTALVYYLLYLFSKEQKGVKWKEHLKRLMLGVDTRIVA